MKRYGRSGWFGQSHRHYLAAKGISTKRYLAKNISSPTYKYYEKKNIEGVYESDYGNAVVVSYGGDGKLYAYDLDMGSRVPLGVVTKKRIRDVDDGEYGLGEPEDEDDDGYGEFYAKKKPKEFIKGGKAEGRPASDFNQEQLRKGIKVEMEHTHDRRIAEEIARDHLAEFPNYYDALAEMEMKLEQPKKGMAYPISPKEAQKAIGRMPEENVKGIKGIEFVNPRGPQEGAWAQYARGSKKVKIFSQPVKEIEERGPVVVHKHVMEYVIPHEVGHHRALRGGKTDRSLEVAEARADANVVGMAPFDKDVTKKPKRMKRKGKKRRYNYTPTYVTGDLAPIAADGVGTAGAAVVPLLPLAVTAGAIYVGAKVVKNSYDKNKAEIAKQKQEAKRKNVKKKSSR